MGLDGGLPADLLDDPGNRLAQGGFSHHSATVLADGRQAHMSPFLRTCFAACQLFNFARAPLVSGFVAYRSRASWVWDGLGRALEKGIAGLGAFDVRVDGIEQPCGIGLKQPHVQVVVMERSRH
jgi:hypothetical protein